MGVPAIASATQRGVMVPPQGRCCATCRHWALPFSHTYGACRRYPPKVTAQGISAWPISGPEDNCGEYTGGAL